MIQIPEFVDDKPWKKRRKKKSTKPKLPTVKGTTLYEKGYRYIKTKYVQGWQPILLNVRYVREHVEKLKDVHGNIINGQDAVKKSIVKSSEELTGMKYEKPKPKPRIGITIQWSTFEHLKKVGLDADYNKEEGTARYTVKIPYRITIVNGKVTGTSGLSYKRDTFAYNCEYIDVKNLREKVIYRGSIYIDPDEQGTLILDNKKNYIELHITKKVR